jgi:hypothetical protein
MAKRRYALSARKANLFYQFSPEAFFADGSGTEPKFRF